MTTVAFTASGDAEPVSPELALVDPVLAERLRAALPEPVLEPEPVAEPVPAIADTNVRVLRLAPAPEVPADARDEGAAPALESVPPPVPPATTSPHARRASRRQAVAPFVAGALFGVLVAVGVVTASGEWTADRTEAVAPPRAAGPVGVTAGSEAKPAQTAPDASSAPARPSSKAPPAKSAGAATGRRPKATAAAKPKASVGQQAGSAAKARAAAKTRAAKAPAAAKSRAAAKAAPVVAPARRFAWAPVAGAVSYRVELFRGDDQVLRATTTEPVFELATEWKHQGRIERLTDGAYRWYVWVATKDGPVAKAVVQAQLQVP